MSNDNSDKDQGLLDQITKYKSNSEQLISSYQDQWSRNHKLVKGLYPDDEITRSKVRKRSKIFFRKIWATRWRLLASFYNAFLRDPDNFKIEGRDTGLDPRKAAVLQKMVEYRRDIMMRTQSLFMKFIWGWMNILDMGWGVGKFRWVYDEEKGKDYPEYILYPNEQVYPDLKSDTKEGMRFIIFENFLSRDELEERNYKNIDKAQPETVPTNIVRQTRMRNHPDPLQNPKDTEYPTPGKYLGTDEKQSAGGEIYRVWECFYKEDDVWMFCVTNASYCILEEAGESVYGDRLPCNMGTCLAEANKLLGEGLPEPLEGPQESLNAGLNQRKDNVAIILNNETIVSRFGNVDLQSLVNSRPGGVTLADDPSAVVERFKPDVTRAAYMEAASDEAMMNEMSGITPGKMGMETAEKATVAQINYSESNAKIDLYIAIIAETFMKDFYSTLAYMIQRFETDETVFRIANESLEGFPPVYNLGFEADCMVQTGMGSVGRELEINQTMLAWDRAIMSNQGAVGLLQTGLVPPGTPMKMIDTTQFMVDLMPKLGKKDFERYFIEFQVPGQGGEQGGQDPALAGRNQPQTGPGGIPLAGPAGQPA